MTKLEFAILEWYSRSYTDNGLSDIESKLKVLRRETTDIGFFTYFNELELNRSNQATGCIPGPFISSKQVPSGAMSVLSLSGSNINFLEVMALSDDEDANQIKEFELGEQF